MSRSLPHTTDRAAIEEVAANASLPIAVESICDELNGETGPRGSVFFGYLGDILDRIARNYDDMQWWISDKGLNFAIVPPEMPELKRFDEFAGRLVEGYWKDGGLPKETVETIVVALDAEGFLLRDELQPAQWKPIAQHNLKFAKKAVKTFSEAIRYPTFRRYVLRRLYLSRERLQKAKLHQADSHLIG